MLAQTLSVGARRVVYYPGSGELTKDSMPARPLRSWRRSSDTPSVVAALGLVASGEMTPLCATELETAELARSCSEGLSGLDHHLVVASGTLARRVQMRSARAAKSFDQFSGHVGRKRARELDAEQMSPTTLEEYAVCPFRYFASHVLSIEAVEEPEQRVVIDARDRGALVHEILERFVREQMAESDGSNGAHSRERLAEIATEVFSRFERFSRTGKSLLWEIERRKLLRIVESERRRDDERRRETGRMPIALEQAFGRDGQQRVEIKLGERTLSFRGLIDRVDRAPDGSLHVIDYKTGRLDAYRGLESDPVDRGRHLQLPIYALAARSFFESEDSAVVASYRFLEHNGDEIEVVLDDETATRFAEVTGAVVGGISEGVFPYHPGDAARDSHANCTWCDFDTVCPPDRAQFYEHNRDEGPVTRFSAFADEPWVR